MPTTKAPRNGSTTRIRKPKAALDRAGLELDTYGTALPFGVHFIGELPSTAARTGGRGVRDAFGWGLGSCAVAEEALERGFCLSVRVPPAAVAVATAVICQQLNRSTCVRYEPEGERLIVWDRDPHNVSGEAAGALG